ncbi:hypothetical protein VIOR3934_17798 [Vibrio orientalis CIP 102891 = ATCC 33934]|uniref:Lipoprotein n=1 Tax=Vibrio orientalis CIP 102891 = ATCC 33934 TaxID=675816 RepID=C9QIZ1_VIBOR|nr:hypothetical protein [Vibrio orientalis]EEX91541.1 hypothetical protein VIA_002183 [Vibrio orientalis CIP 102891 = ATCC 33934]EGU47360.1 hypothetical protein VIOR3934_17798 [Vibrio orientalis CIP 102891 = ATCC 33934]
MKKSLLALIVAGSFVLAGCSSSGGAGNSDADRDVDPEFGVTPPDFGETPDWGVPDTEHTPDRPLPDHSPDWGVDTTPDWGLQPSQPPIDNAPDRPNPIDPDFGLDTTPEWGLQPSQPPIDNAPDRPEPDFGDTPGWGGEVGDIHVDGDGVIRYEGQNFQITGYDDSIKEFTIVDPNGVTLYARVMGDGRIGIIYNQKVYFLNSHRFAFTPDYDFDIDTDLDYIAKDDITNILNLQKEAIKQLNQDELIGEYLKYASGVFYNKEKMEQAAYDVATHYLLTDAELDAQHKLGVLAFSFNGNVSIAHSIVVDALKHIDNNASDVEKTEILRYINGKLGSEHETIQHVYEAVYRHGTDMLDRIGVSGNEGNRYAIALVRNIQRHGWDHVKGKLEEHIGSNPQPMQMSTPQRNIDQNRVRSDIRNRLSK